MPTVEATRKVPPAALQFQSFVELEFAEGGDDNSAPIKMLARSAEPIDHWYWGRVVHDMQGMKLRKEKCPLDYCHWSGEIVGYADKFKANNNGLVVEGKLVAFQSDDRAAEVIHKGRSGVPYEASIDFNGPGIRIEQLGEGTSAKVNGYTFEGPGVIIREWPLRSVAVCPYGADPNTRSELAEGDEEIDVLVFSEGDEIMPKEAKPEPAAKELAEKPEVPKELGEVAPVDSGGDLRAAFKAELDKYTKAFGATHGATYLAEGKSFEEASTDYITLQGKELAAKDATIAELKAKLASIDTGEIDPATFSSTDPADKPTGEPSKELEAKLGSSGLARFAAGIKLPGKAA